MSDHKIEREAVLWAWATLHEGDPETGDVEVLVASVLSGEMARPRCAMTQAEYARLVRVAIAYVESAKNHIDTVLELETNLTRATGERDSIATVAAYYRLADYNQRRRNDRASNDVYRDAAAAMDQILGDRSLL